MTVSCLFSKWPEATALPDKTATGVAEFLFLCFTRHGCCKVKIADQGGEFVNQVNDILKYFCCGDAVVLYFRWMMSFVVSVASSVIWRVHTIHKAMGLMKGSIKHCNDSYWSLLNLSKTAGINIWMQYSFHIEYRARTQPSIHPFFLCMVVTLDCQLSSLCSALVPVSVTSLMMDCSKQYSSATWRYFILF